MGSLIEYRMEQPAKTKNMKIAAYISFVNMLVFCASFVNLCAWQRRYPSKETGSVKLLLQQIYPQSAISVEFLISG